MFDLSRGAEEEMLQHVQAADNSGKNHDGVSRGSTNKYSPECNSEGPYKG